MTTATITFPSILQLEGARLAASHGQEVAYDYGDWAGEYVALKRAAGVVYLGHSTQLELSGADRAGFLNRLCTNHVAALRPGEGCETFLTNAKGHIIAHALIFARPESIVLRTVSGQATQVLAHLDHYLVTDDVRIEDRSGQWTELLLTGAQSPTIMQQIAPRLPASHLEAIEVEHGGRPVSIRCVYAGNRQVFLISADLEAAARLWPTLRQAGARPCGHRALDALRIELGWPVYGRDITEENLPQEVGRDTEAISFRKGCYLGQETVARIDARGHVNRSLVGLTLNTTEVPSPGEELRKDGRPAGYITTAAFSPDLGFPIALGYVRRQHKSPGTDLDSNVGRATVTSLPME